MLQELFVPFAHVPLQILHLDFGHEELGETLVAFVYALLENLMDFGQSQYVDSVLEV